MCSVELQGSDQSRQGWRLCTSRLWVRFQEMLLMRSRVPQGLGCVLFCGEVCSQTETLIHMIGVKRERVLAPRGLGVTCRNNINGNPPWGGSLNQASRSKILLMVAISNTDSWNQWVETGLETGNLKNILCFSDSLNREPLKWISGSHTFQP